MTGSGAALPGQGAHAGDRTQPQPGARPVKAPLLEIRGLHKRYGETVALHNIDLTLHRGEVVVILGPSGCEGLDYHLNRIEWRRPGGPHRLMGSDRREPLPGCEVKTSGKGPDIGGAERLLGIGPGERW